MEVVFGNGTYVPSSRPPELSFPIIAAGLIRQPCNGDAQSDEYGHHARHQEVRADHAADQYKQEQ
jgi:hypothetical protein